MPIIGSLPYTLANGTTADATQVMADFNTIVNGVNSPTTGAASIPSVQSHAYNYAADTGTVNNVIISVTPSPASYTDGLRVYTKASNTNTSSTMTVIMGSLGSKSVVIDQAGTLPPIGCYILNMHYAFEYDSTQDKAILVNPSRATGSFTITLTGFSGSAPTGTVNYAIGPDGKTAYIYNTANISSGNSNATTMTGTGIPAILSPITSKNIWPINGANNTTITSLLLVTGTSTTWTYGVGGGSGTGGFTGTASSKGIYQQEWSFTLD